MIMRKCTFCLVLVLWFTLMPPAAWGQEFRGTVQGLVTDTSGAVIPGATLTLHNVKTGIQKVMATHETRIYRFDNVDSGVYTLTTELPGFSKTVQENLSVQAQGDVTVNVTLKIGEVNDTVTVTETPVAVSFNQTNITLTI